MTDPQLPQTRAGDLDRQRAADRLADGYGQGALTMEEYEERLDRAHTAITVAELATLVQDLPLPADRPVEVERGSRLETPLWEGRTRIVRAAVAAVAAVALLVGFAGADAISVFGSTELRVAADEDPTTVQRIRVLSVFGSTDITVSSGAASNGVISVFGSAQCDAVCDPTSAGPDIEISGLSLFGSVEVHGG